MNKYELFFINIFYYFLYRPTCYLAAPNKNENTYLKPSLQGVQLFFGWKTWQSHRPFRHSEKQNRLRNKD